MAQLNNIVIDLVSKAFSNTLVSAAEVSVDATYKNVTTGEYNPGTGSIGKTETNVAVKVIKKNETVIPIGGGGGSSSATQELNVTAASGFLEFLVKPITGVIPSQGIDDELTIDNTVYKVMDVKSMNMGSDRLIYRIRAVG